MKMGDKFLQDFGMQNGTQLTRALGGACLMTVLHSNKMGRFGNKETAVSESYQDDILKEKALLHLMDISVYWANDLIDVLAESCEADEIQSPLFADGTGRAFSKIIEWAEHEVAAEESNESGE